ncbi:MAG: hypothetical protein QUS14_03610 [Pyrinomonadaceae bacterium]|nr:hypothetical protein [Pyrinomonadaceae bacterium]
MRAFINNLLFGKDSKVSGAIAVTIVAFIALGCACGDLAKLAEEGNTSSSNSSRTASNNDPFGDNDTTSSSDDSELPSDSEIKALVATLTADFARAIQTGDFTDLYEDASMDFKSTYSQSEMEDVFKTFIDNKRVVTPILSKAMNMEPEFAGKPYIRTEKGLTILVANGKFPTKPVPTNFEYDFVKRNGEWQMLKLIVKIQ